MSLEWNGKKWKTMPPLKKSRINLNSKEPKWTNNNPDCTLMVKTFVWLNLIIKGVPLSIHLKIAEDWKIVNQKILNISISNFFHSVYMLIIDELMCVNVKLHSCNLHFNFESYDQKSKKERTTKKTFLSLKCMENEITKQITNMKPKTEGMVMWIFTH